VNNDLVKAERELARGNQDEARVYAWNALATIEPDETCRLLRIAEALDDELLVRELERRGIHLEKPAAPSEDELEERF
jgi:hypothetical protein